MPFVHRSGRLRAINALCAGRLLPMHGAGVPSVASELRYAGLRRAGRRGCRHRERGPRMRRRTQRALLESALISIVTRSRPDGGHRNRARPTGASRLRRLTRFPTGPLRAPSSPRLGRFHPVRCLIPSTQGLKGDDKRHESQSARAEPRLSAVRTSREVSLRELPIDPDL
jgi:hypothetical protein